MEKKNVELLFLLQIWWKSTQVVSPHSYTGNHGRQAVSMIAATEKRARGSMYESAGLRVQSLSCVLLFSTSWTVACQALCSWDFSGKNTGMRCHFLLPRIFLTQESNLSLLCLPHWQILYRWATCEAPRIPLHSKIIEDLRVLLVWVISINIYCIRNWIL